VGRAGRNRLRSIAINVLSYFSFPLTLSLVHRSFLVCYLLSSHLLSPRFLSVRCPSPFSLLFSLSLLGYFRVVVNLSILHAPPTFLLAFAARKEKRGGICSPFGWNETRPAIETKRSWLNRS